MRALLAMAGIMLALPAFAAEPESKDTGEQFFRKESCAAEPDAFFDECGCKVQIRYQQLEGAEAVSKALAPEEDLRGYCSGIFQASSDEPQQAGAWKKADKDAFKQSIYEFHSVQEITYQTPEWLNVLTQDYVYSGGAHGNAGLSSTLYDMETGKPVEYLTLINLDAVTDANKAIQKQLDARKKDVFDEFVGVKEPGYIKADGTCNGCIFVLREDGLHAMFQQYAVAPYSTGVVEVSLPDAFFKRPVKIAQKGN